MKAIKFSQTVMSMKRDSIDQLILEWPGSSLPHEQLRGRLYQV
jgi:hypothetical protein